MGNYFVLDSKFTPYTFEELIKPYQMYNEAYKEQEAALDAAAEKEFTDSLREGSVSETLFNNAVGNLKSVSDELATKGLVQGIRGRIKNATRDYKRSMDILTSAQKQLNAERERRSKAGEKYVYQNPNLDLDDFLYGKTPSGRSENLDDITKDIAAKFSARAGSITEETWRRVLDNNGKPIKGYWDITSRNGLTPDQLDSILNSGSYENDPNISAEQKEVLRGFRKIITDKLESIGYNDYQKYEQGKILNAITTGAYGAVGAEKHAYKDDKVFDQAPHWASINLQKEKWNVDPNNPQSATSPYYGKTPEEIQEMVKKASEAKGSGKDNKTTEYNTGVKSYKISDDGTKYSKEASYGKDSDVSKNKEGDAIRKESTIINIGNANELLGGIGNRTKDSYSKGREKVRTEMASQFNSNAANTVRNMMIDEIRLKRYPDFSGKLSDGTDMSFSQLTYYLTTLGIQVELHPVKGIITFTDLTGKQVPDNNDVDGSGQSNNSSESSGSAKASSIGWGIGGLKI